MGITLAGGQRTQEANDLFFGKSLLYVQSPVVWDWTPTSFATQIREDVAGTPTHSWRHSSSSQCVWAQTLPDSVCWNSQSERAAPHANLDREILGYLGSQTVYADYNANPK